MGVINKANTARLTYDEYVSVGRSAPMYTGDIRLVNTGTQEWITASPQTYGMTAGQIAEIVDEPMVSRNQPWVDDFKKITRPTKIQQRKPTPVKRSNLPKQYVLKECLSAFRDFEEKQNKEIYLTGSVALSLQKKISRNTFSDLDIIVVGKYDLDDDIVDFESRSTYERNDRLSDGKTVVYDNVKIDIFNPENGFEVNAVTVRYNGEEYLCQSYKDIIMAKINMVAPKIKDWEELYNHSFNITF